MLPRWLRRTAFDRLLEGFPPAGRFALSLRNFTLRVRFAAGALVSSSQVVAFRCNICGGSCRAPLPAVTGRETPSCYHCGSTLRQRSLVHLLSLGLFGKSLPIGDFPPTGARGVGMSDPENLARRLARKLDYRNTFFHREPRLDACNVDPEHEGRCDFVICSEVLEHVPPPVEEAFTGLFRLLKPGGFCVFSVPYRTEGQTLEHFPELHRYRIEKRGRRRLLVNTTADGRVQRFGDLRFHGGRGETLEMRSFSEPDLVRMFREAGFEKVDVGKIQEPRYGIIWTREDSVPLVARRPPA